MYLSAPKVYTMPGFKSNVKDLQGLARVIKSASFKTKAQDIVNLYTEKKIRNIRTAENAIHRISQPRYQRSGQAEAEYQKLVNKYSAAEPMTGRLERESKRKKSRPIPRRWCSSKKKDEWDKDKEADPTLLVEVKPKDKDKFKTEVKKRHVPTWDSSTSEPSTSDWTA